MRCFLLLILFCFSSLSAWAYVGGSGTVDDPLQITSCQDLQNINNNLTASYTLNTDVNCADSRNWNNNQGFLPIGRSDLPFSGTFDGANHAIYNLYINRPNMESKGGLFAYNSGMLSNIRMMDADITAQDWVGGLVSINMGKINNCFVNGTITGTHETAVGGLVGTNQHGNISNAYSNANVTGILSVGGLVGSNSGTIISSYATGNVSGIKRYIGGLVGLNSGAANVDQAVGLSNGDINNSYATGNVEGDESVGGLVGQTGSSTIAGSYAIGQVRGNRNVGGLVGNVLNPMKVVSSYYDSATTSQNDTGKGVPLTTQQMFQQASYQGWDFTNSWRIAEGHDYPKLPWQPLDFTIRFMKVNSPQQVQTGFQITIIASNDKYNDKVYLHSSRGDVSPDYVTLTNGYWSGDVSVYASGKRDALQMHWGDDEMEGDSSSNLFDVNDLNGQLAANAGLKGVMTDDAGKVVPWETVNIYDNDPNNKPWAKLVYTTTTDGSGNYILNNMMPGQYYLEAKQTGSQDFIQKVQLASQRMLSLNIVLENDAPVQIGGGPKVPVILLPGIMGSTLTGRAGDIYPRLPFITPQWDSGELKLLDPYWQVGWSNLVSALKKVGYQKGKTLFLAPYDWAIPNISIRNQFLLPWIKKAKKKSGSNKVDIIAHSMGGLVTRSYLQSSFYNNDVRKFAMVGTPNKGAVGPYYIWEGGDPIAADERMVGGTTKIGKYFYSNTIEYLAQNRDLDSVCKFSWSAPYTPTKCNHQKVYLLAHHEGQTVGELLGVFDDVIHNQQTGSSATIVHEENTFVKALDAMPCLNSKGCVNRKNQLYEFKPAMSVLSADASRVQTHLFIGNIPGQTMRTIYVNNPSLPVPQYFYKDGEPLWTFNPLRATGDNTVWEESVKIDPSLPPEYAEAEHGKLINAFIGQLVNFITGKNISTLSVNKKAIAQKLLIINTTGDVEPNLTATGLKGAHLKLTPEEEAIEFNDSGIVEQDPVNGNYNVSIKSPDKGDYDVSIRYIDPVNDKVFGEMRFKNSANSTALANYAFSIQGDSITFNRIMFSPINLVMNNVANKIQVTWQDPTGDANKDVSNYELFWKPDSQPYYQYIGAPTGKSYLTDIDWSKMMSGSFVVKAELKSGFFTVYSEPTFYVPPEQK